MRRLARSAIALAACCGTPALATAGLDPPAWTRPIAPFHIVGPISYVGTEGIGVYLIRTRAGLILIDGGMEESAPDVERAIAALGLRVSDIRLILATHAHSDHAGGLARLQHDSGATFAASAGDRQAFETGMPASDTRYEAVRFPPVHVGRVIADGRPVSLGGVSLTPVLTPGHTPGCTTWTMRVVDGGKPLRVVFPCSLTVAGNKLVGNRGYPGIVADFRRTFARLHTMQADVMLPAHTEFGDVLGRARRSAAGDRNAFVDPALLPRMVAQAEAAFTKELAQAAPPGAKP
jgi:metallo-beta-lactamase class B